MGLGIITEILGHSGIRTLWKVLLIANALTILQFPKWWMNLIDVQIFDLPLITGRYIQVLLTILFVYMMHKNQY